jgi:hypothetical protein
MTTIAERLLRVGIKASIPFIGDLVAAVVEETGGFLLDSHEKQKARDITSHLLKSVEASLEEAGKSGELNPQSLEYLMPTAESLLRNYAISASEWAAVNFDPEAAVRQALKNGAHILRGLSEDEIAITRLILISLYRALEREREMVVALEPEFRHSVLNRLDKIAEEISGSSAEQFDAVVRVTALAMIELPRYRWHADRSPPGALLRSDYCIVPFHGRERELDELETWCRSPSSIGVHLYTGAGGIGKTRLIHEACSRMQANGWTAGFLATNTTSVTGQVWTAVIRRCQPLLVAVDYAETRQGDVCRLLREVVKADDSRVRIVLLARSADDWWERIKTEGDGVGDLLAGPATQRFPIGALASTATERIRSYKLALSKFSEILGPASDDASVGGVPADIDAQYYRIVLLLHMAALAAVEGVQVTGDQGVLDWMLSREKRFWAKQAAIHQLPPDVLDAIESAMALITLGGGVDSRSEAIEVLSKLDLLQDQTTLVRNAVTTILHDTYPGTKWIEPILPDLLGEHLIQTVVNKSPDTYLNEVFGAGNAEP